MEAEARRRLAEQRRAEATEEGQPSAGSAAEKDGAGTVAQSGEALNPPAESGTSTGSGSVGPEPSFDGAGTAVTAGDAGHLLNLVAKV